LVLTVEIHEFACELNEEITSVASLRLKVDVENPSSKEKLTKESTFFVIGTVYEEGKTTSEKGRLLVFEQTSPEERKMRLASSFAVRGCVYALAGCLGNIVAAVNSGVRQ
jgi:hypothetical protein